MASFMLLRRLGLFAGLLAAAVASQAQRPNVLFIVVDDLSPTVRSYGGYASAPNMARLASWGVQMQRAYVSVAVCAPSRTAFLTGLRPDTSQVWTIGPYFRQTSRGQGMQVVTLPELFRKAGYNTTGAGKIWHPGTPSGGMISSEGGGDMCPAERPDKISVCRSGPGRDQPGSWSEPYWFCDQYTNDTCQSPAMQQWGCSLHGQPRQQNASYSWPSCGGGCVQSPACQACFKQCGTWGQQGSWDACDCDPQCYPEGLIADRTIQILKEKAANPSGGPWFHAMGLKRPHLSYRAPARFFEMYDAATIPLPTHRRPAPTAPPISYSHSCVADTHTTGLGLAELQQAGLALYTGKQTAQCSMEQMNRTVHEFNGTGTSLIEIHHNDSQIRDLRRAYYAVISFMDEQLGRVLDTLEETKLVDNTIVTFIGDHGYQNGEKGEWCKSNNFELAVRIPMLVAPPRASTGWARGRVEPGVVESVDLYATLADLASVPLPQQQVAGETLRPLLAEQRGQRTKNWALSQWARRPSCTTRHGCPDGAGNPYDKLPDQALMGYTLRTERWRYTVWLEFDWGEGGDPKGEATMPIWDKVSALELYDHLGDTGDMHSGETFEWTNLAYDPAFKSTVETLHPLLVEAVKSGLVKPMKK